MRQRSPELECAQKTISLTRYMGARFLPVEIIFAGSKTSVSLCVREVVIVALHDDIGPGPERQLGRHIPERIDRDSAGLVFLSVLTSPDMYPLFSYSHLQVIY